MSRAFLESFGAIKSDCENMGKGTTRPEEFGVGTGCWQLVATGEPGKTRRRTDPTDACNRGEALSEFQIGM